MVIVNKRICDRQTGRNNAVRQNNKEVLQKCSERINRKSVRE